LGPGGDTLAWEDDVGSVSIWSLSKASSRIRTLAGHRTLLGNKGISDIAFGPDGLTLVTAGGDRTIRLWSVSDGRELRRMRGHRAAITAVAFSPDGKTVVSGSADRSVRLWDVTAWSWQPRLEGTAGDTPTANR
jgi:WD40 repeat protein